MRSAQKSNRSRGRGNRKGGGGGGGNNINRVYDSAGPEGKVRGTPQQIIDKYLSLARDAQTSGDRVTAENFLQHAEHYQRILITATQAQEQARRDQQEAATEARSNAPEEQPSAEASEQSGQPDLADAPQPEIGGMAMIDADQGQDQLLVTPEADAPSKPRRNGDSRRKPRKPAEAEDKAAPTETQAAEGS